MSALYIFYLSQALKRNPNHAHEEKEEKGLLKLDEDSRTQ